MQEEGWTIDIDAVGAPAADPDGFDTRLAAFEAELEPYGGAVATSDERDRYGARFSLDTESLNPVDVLERGLEVFLDASAAAGLPSWQVVHCEILTYAEDDATATDDATAVDDDG
jgi:hypothetical protein